MKKVLLIVVGIVLVALFTPPMVGAQEATVSTVGVEGEAGSTVQVPVNLNIPSELTDGQELGSLTVWISYDPALLSINYIQTAWGSIISAASVAGAQFNVPTPGDARIGIVSTFGMSGVFQPLNTEPGGTIITIGFDVNSSANMGDSGTLDIYKLLLTNETAETVTSSPVNGTFTVATPTPTSTHIPGFNVAFSIVGLLGAAYYFRRPPSNLS